MDKKLEARISRLEKLLSKNKSIKNESHGASDNLIKFCRENFYPLIDQISNTLRFDLPTYDDPSYDEYSELKNALLDLRSAVYTVREAVENLK